MTLKLKRSLSSPTLFVTGDGRKLGLVAELPSGTFVFKTKIPGTGPSAPFPDEPSCLEALYQALNIDFLG